MTPPIRIDVSVVFDRDDDIEACLDTLFRYTPGDVRLDVNVVSNRGATAMADRLEERFPRVRVIRNPARRGFAENHNITLRQTDAEYVLVLNDDLVFLPESVVPALKFMERPDNQDVAVLGPKLLNPDGSLQPSTYRFPTVRRAFLSVTGIRQLIPFAPALNRLAALAGRGAGRSRFWAHDRTVDVDTFRGAYMLVRGEAVRDVGVMDEASRIGVEEVEWHKRMKDAGWRVVFHPDAAVTHLGSRTIAIDPSTRNEFLKGFLNYFRKHRSTRAYRTFAAAAAAGLKMREIALRIRGRREDAGIARQGAVIAWDALRQL